ncbi:DUF1661 domain-containing protein [Porphyromonas gingivalis]|nr:DUF1661 domain-containing protein [Porphyromonas gingivalis]
MAREINNSRAKTGKFSRAFSGKTRVTYLC